MWRDGDNQQACSLDKIGQERRKKCFLSGGALVLTIAFDSSSHQCRLCCLLTQTCSEVPGLQPLTAPGSFGSALVTQMVILDSLQSDLIDGHCDSPASDPVGIPNESLCRIIHIHIGSLTSLFHDYVHACVGKMTIATFVSPCRFPNENKILPNSSVCKLRGHFIS